jgi:hypothetical protein
MRKALTTIALAGAMLVPIVLERVSAQNAAPLDPIIEAWDKGPDKIDVSKYPPEIKKKYKTFNELCGRCHPISRAVNCDFALEDDWERYIKRMMRRGKGLISPDDALAAFEFAIYDSKIRKKDLYERKLKALAAAAK